MPAPVKDHLQRAANDWELADAMAIKALNAGTADPEQQKRALYWILEHACMLKEFAFEPGPDDRSTNIALGRQFAGHMIVKLMNVNPAMVKRKPHSDPPGESQ